MTYEAPKLVEPAAILVREVMGCARLLAKSYQQADSYIKSMPRVQADGDVDWRWDEAQGLRWRRHKELLALVPAARQLKAHLNQVRDGGKALDEEMLAHLVAVLLKEFAMHEDPVPDVFGFWKLSVSSSLVSALWWHLCQYGHNKSPEFYEKLQKLKIPPLNASTLGEIRNSYRRSEQERKYLSKGRDALVKDFQVLSQRLYQTLSVEEFALLKECGELFAWHAQIGYFG
jgi:hypothetical protein